MNATHQSIAPVKSQDLNAAEVSWFAPLCSDDYRHLDVPDGSLRSSFRIERTAKLADAFKVAMPRQTWFELLELAAGRQVA